MGLRGFTFSCQDLKLKRLHWTSDSSYKKKKKDKHSSSLSWNGSLAAPQRGHVVLGLRCLPSTPQAFSFVTLLWDKRETSQRSKLPPLGYFT